MTLNGLASTLPQYDKREAYSIVRRLLYDTFGWTLADIYSRSLDSLTSDEQRLLNSCMERLRQGEPVQYVTGKTTFCGREFYVHQGCLIPRPETEELCAWIKEVMPHAQTLLDVGTGSGCIAVTMKCELPQCSVTAWDVSDEAIAIARHNASKHGASVEIVRQDALNAPHDDEARWDVIVSNPPYICYSERADMESNVLDYEPHIALFVPDGEALLFYRAIAAYATHTLRHDGQLFFEINPLYAVDIRTLLDTLGFQDITFRRDEFDKERMVMARKG